MRKVGHRALTSSSDSTVGAFVVEVTAMLYDRGGAKSRIKRLRYHA